MIDPTRYVVLDVETNGLSSLKDDLLSITIYKPDDKRMYNRYLPLELDKDVYTTQYNGITKKTLKGATALTQYEFEELFTNFELNNRIILTYGNIDEKFIKNYFKRKGLSGYLNMNFYNFKHDIISSSFSLGNVTKDNLCKIFGIEGILDVHTGCNDCLLEWELFRSMDGKKLFVSHDHVFEFNSDYIIPTSYLSTFPNFKFMIEKLPKIKVSSSVIYEFALSKKCSKKIEKFETNISGITIEHLINVMLSVEEIDSVNFENNNIKKMKCLGKLPSCFNIIPASFNLDGTISAIKKEDQDRIDRINETTLQIKAAITPLVNFIKSEIFQEKKIYSQEIVINIDSNCFSRCDLSNEFSVLEIKTTSDMDFNKYKYQLYYQSNGRNCYLLQIDWGNYTGILKFILSAVKFYTERTF